MSDTAPVDANVIQPADSVDEVVAAARSALWQTDVLQRGAVWLAVALASPLAIVAADHVIPGGLPLMVIRGAAALWGLTLLVFAGAVVIRLRRERPTALFAARRVEHVCDVRHNRVINSLLSNSAPLEATVQQAIAAEAAHELAERPARTGRRLSERSGAGRWVAAALAIWVVFAWVSPKSIWTSLARMFGSRIDAPSATQLRLLRPGPQDVAYLGEPLLLEVEVAGRSAREVTFERLTASEPGAEVLLRYVFSERNAQAERDVRTLQLAPHETGPRLAYRLRGGDAELRGELTLQPQPAQADLWIELAPPRYTGDAPRTTRERDVEAWYGSAATFHVRANTPIRDPVFVLADAQGEQRTRMTVNGSEPQTAAASFPLRVGGEYWIEFRDAWGRTSQPAPRRRLRVRIDQPPALEFTRPVAEEAPDGRVDVTQSPWLEVSASDDLQLAGLDLFVERRGLATRRPLLTAEQLGGRAAAVFALPMSEIEIAIGETLRVWCEAADNRCALDGRADPQVTRSRVLELSRSAPPALIPAEGVEGSPGGEGGPGSGAGGVAKGSAPGGTGGDGQGNGEREGEGQETEVVSVPGRGDGPGAGQDGPGDSTSAGADDGAGEGAEPGDDGDPGRPGDPSGGQSASQPADAEPPSDGSAADDLARELEDFAREHQGTLDKMGDNPPGEQPDEPSSSNPRSEPPASQPSSQPDDEQSGEPQAADPPADEPQQPEAPPEDAPSNPPEPPADAPEPQDGDPEQGQNQPEAPEDESDPAASQPADEQPPAASQPTEDAPPEDAPPAEAGPKPGEAPGTQEESEKPAAGVPGGPPAEAPRATPTPAAGEAEAQPPVLEDAPLNPATPAPDSPPDEALEPAGGPEIPPGLIDEMEQVAELLEQDDVAVDAELKALGLDEQARQQFLKRLEGLRGLARAAGLVGPPSEWLAEQRERGVLQVGQLKRGVSDEVSTTPSADPSGLDRIQPPVEQRVPPELQAVLDAYYEAMARRAQDAPTSAPARSNP